MKNRNSIEHLLNYLVKHSSNLGGKSLNAGVIGQLLSRGATIMRLARAFVASPIYDSQFGIQFPKLTPSRLQVLYLPTVVFYKLAIPGLFIVYFRTFQTNITISHNIMLKNVRTAHSAVFKLTVSRTPVSFHNH